MKINIFLGRVSLVASIVFVILCVLAYLGVPTTRFLGGSSAFFSIPLYSLIFISFIYTGYIWFKDKNKLNFKYYIYSIISCVMTTGMLAYILYHYARTMSNFG